VEGKSEIVLNTAMYIKVRVIAGAKKEKFKQVSGTHVEISVKEKAEQNLANRRIIELIASYFKLPAKQIRIISGHRSPSKILSLPD
jgi:uncharacterized protein YggU (UPF0235/DUF167 family)